MKFIKKILNFVLLSFFEIVSSKINNKITLVRDDDVEFKFYTPNKLTLYRANTFFSKEPETIDWIDNFSEKSVFWDVGSNVGIFACYAAKKKNCEVYAFEPSVFNLEILSKNIFINKLNNLITILPFPLTNEMKAASFNMTSSIKGDAISTFGEEFTFDGSEIQTKFKFKTIGIKMDDVNKLLKLPFPDYIKIDVDGIEHLILNGGEEVLKKTKEILIEINDEFKIQEKKSIEYLEKAGLSLYNKNSQGNDKSKKIYNQIWKRK